MKRRILLITILIIELVLLVQFVQRIYSIRLLRRRVEYARAQKDARKAVYLQKAREIAYYKTDTYVEEIARSKLGYALPQDFVYIIPSGRRVSASLPRLITNEARDDHSNWGAVIRWYKVFFAAEN